MKTLKFISMLLLAFMFGACDDDPAEEAGNGGGAGSGSPDLVSVSWGIESKSVLKNEGQVQVPVRLSAPADKAVKVTFAAQYSDNAEIAREGIDFDLPDKVVTFSAGDTLAYLTVDLLDNGKAETDRTVVLKITGVYGGNVGSENTCSLYIMNNAFVEFQYRNRETYESAGTYKVPVIVTGDIRRTATFAVRVKEGGTALEGTHFSLPQTEFTLEPGATLAEVGVELIDDDEVNDNRWFELEIVSVTGSNAVIGKSVSVCRVTIVSEEVLKTVSFGAVDLAVKEGENLSVPVKLDKAPASGENVEVTFSVKVSDGTVEGEDFTMEEKTLIFTQGQTEKELMIQTSDNGLIGADKTIEISFKEVNGAVFEKTDVCLVTIKNDDFPSFEESSYEVEEDKGDFVINVILPGVQSDDLRFSVKIIAGNGCNEGTHYTLETTELVINAGKNQGEVHVNIGHELEWTSAPEFTVYIAGSSDGSIVWDEKVCASVITLRQCGYRKFLGSWTMSSDSPEAMISDGVFEITAGENGNEFNKRYVCKAKAGEFCENVTNTDLIWHMDYDKSTKAIKMVMGEKINATDLYMNGSPVYHAWYYYNNIGEKSINTNWSGDDTLLLECGDDYFLCIAILNTSDNTWAAQSGWHKGNIKLTRKK